MIIDTIQGCIRVPDAKRAAILDMLTKTLESKSSCDYYMLEKLTGNLISLSWAFGPISRMMTMSIYAAMKPYSLPGRSKNVKLYTRMPLTEEATNDIRFWIESFDEFDGFRSIWPDKKHDITFYTDAAGNNLNNFGAWAGWTRYIQFT